MNALEGETGVVPAAKPVTFDINSPAAADRPKVYDLDSLINVFNGLVVNLT